ncbi:Mitochondrial cardiolipin hydrolase [Acropora cervicornis]|uniref:Mitochondrial cardiolipin hydrolase n=2 Tax=Acropora TaxID=6127 RepID=A0AAD9R1X9_ACRCE|nr:Mitochondrial cardiolipin hydrolase [Acropora cervicornis]
MADTSLISSFGFSRFLRISWIVGVIAHTTYVFIKSVCEQSVESSPLQKRLNPTASTVLFFPDKHLACRQLLFEGRCNRRNCQFLHEETSLSKLIRVLLGAKESLDVCVFTINCRELADAVVLLHKNGVVVRVLTDDEQMGTTGSQIEKFRREGIQVRHDLSSFFMHHKFAVIDRKQLLNGSFNWTRQAVTGNRENVMITSDQDIVKAFSEEFEALWEKYDPCKRTQLKAS